MPYIVVKHEESVLSRVSPNATLSWIDIGVSRCTEYRYAVTFETFRGADGCARMQGGKALLAGADDSRVAAMASVDDTPLRVAHNWGLGGVE